MIKGLPRPPVLHAVRTQRLLLRPFREADAEMYRRVVEAGREHLGSIYERVMGEDGSVEGVAKRMRDLRAMHLARKACAFGVLLPNESEIIGSVGLLWRIGAGAGEIGYWIAASHTRRGFASEAAAAMARIGFELHRLRRMEIHTDPTNLASVGVARRLGFTEQVTFHKGVLTENGPIRDNVMWAMLREEYPSSPAATLPIEALDRRGRRSV